MPEERYRRIAKDPKFQAMVAMRHRLAYSLSAIMLAVYFGFILLIAFTPKVLAAKLFAGAVTSVGIVVGLGVIFTAFILTGIYVYWANGHFDQLNSTIVKETL